VSHYPFLTQKEHDSETGLDYFGVRYYSASPGRFTSPDEFTGGPDELFHFAAAAADNPTFYADLTNPQSLNKYQYTHNNPLNMTDNEGPKPMRTVAVTSYLKKVIRENRWSLVLSGLLLAIGTMNVLLIMQNVKLRALLQESAPKRLKTGDVISSFTAQDLAGASIHVDYGHDSPRRVFLFFSPHCRYSASQFSSWIPIIQNGAANKTEVLR
jgi:RHS repeat-associated protein